MKRGNYYFLLIFIPVGFLLWFLFSKTEEAPLRYLPYFGPKNYSGVKDTVYHTVGDFNFIDQYGNKFSQESTKDKIYVTEYFFTTCKSICPVMNNNLIRIYKKYKEKNNFLILSHTVDPETDSIPQLKAYADEHGVTNKNWIFVTGNKKDLYEMARKSYLLNAEEGNGGEEDFIHTQNFALVDKEKHIRGFYDGTDSLEIVRLDQDIALLLKEYEFKAGKN
jgi:protein SCO1/2